MMNKTTFNGICLDDVIDGFHTLSVMGRQFVDIDFVATDNAFIGTTFRKKHFGSREIEVSFLIKSSSRESMRLKTDKLRSLLDSDKPKKLMFDDESEFYYEAMYSGCELETGLITARSGTLRFICFDPRRYSNNVKSWSALGASLIMINDGGSPADIDYEINVLTDTGYVEFESNGKKLTIGRKGSINHFKSGDVIRVNGYTRTITVNGYPRASEEVLGSTYFYSEIGETHINISTNGSVNVTASIRERWL